MALTYVASGFGTVSTFSPPTLTANDLIIMFAVVTGGSPFSSNPFSDNGGGGAYTWYGTQVQSASTVYGTYGYKVATGSETTLSITGATTGSYIVVRGASTSPVINTLTNTLRSSTTSPTSPSLTDASTTDLLIWAGPLSSTRHLTALTPPSTGNVWNIVTTSNTNVYMSYLLPGQAWSSQVFTGTLSSSTTYGSFLLGVQLPSVSTNNGAGFLGIL